jgi:membrane protein DedA with SNARE-associated domain
MEQFMEILTHWSDPEFVAQYRKYLVIIVFLYSFFEVVFPPLPGDSLLILSGSLAGLSDGSPIVIIISASLGTFASSTMLYLLGAKMGKSLLHSSKESQLLNYKMFHRMEKWFRKYGFWTIVLSRFIPVVRSGIILAAGMVNMEKSRSFLAVGVSIIVSTSIFVASGSYLGQNWRKLPEFWNSRIKRICLTILCLIIAYLVLVRFYNYLKNPKPKAAGEK